MAVSHPTFDQLPVHFLVHQDVSVSAPAFKAKRRRRKRGKKVAQLPQHQGNTRGTLSSLDLLSTGAKKFNLTTLPHHRGAIQRVCMK